MLKYVPHGYSLATLMPFANPFQRAIHFQKHGHEFAASSAIEYEQMADAFMTSPLLLTMRECIRPGGSDRVRINIANKHFGVAIVSSSVIKTFYIIPVHQILRRGDVTSFFSYECARINV